MTKTSGRPDLLTADELEAYRRFDSVTLFFTRAEIEGSIGEDYTGPEIRCMYPELGPVVGYAVTSEWTTLDAESPDLNFLDYYEWITGQPAPRVVVNMDADERTGRTASFGGMQARTLRRLGVAGVVSTIGLHKVSVVRAAGMPAWTTEGQWSPLITTSSSSVAIARNASAPTHMAQATIVVARGLPERRVPVVVPG